ncbi:hypothetical protein [Pseudonocardia hydrocarbonoxydans]|uniref:hypothetical protein n=1 Tax=Pseudonocardia hydrocarbonoxydans TaxID=76726 RepID=UPI0031DF6A81
MRMISVTVSVVVGLLLAASTAAAQPAPPPNPSDDALDASRAAVVERAAELGRLSGLAAELDGRAATARAVLQDRREVAFERLTALQAAEVAADAAAERAADAGVATTAARNAVDQARLRLDQAAAATYQQTLDLGPLGLLTGAQTPEELVARAEFGNLVAGELARIIDAVQRAHIGQVNAESLARAAADEAEAAGAAAEQARAVADAAVADASAAVADQEAELGRLDAERAGIEAQLASLTVADQRLREQRGAYLSYQERAARAAEEERRRAERAAASTDTDAGSSSGPAAALGPEYGCRTGVPRWGPVKRWVSDAGQLLRCRFGIESVGGVGPRGRVSDHPLGLALDFFVDRETGDALAECALRNRGPLAVKYVIFRQRINTGSGWRMMEDRGSPVENHMEHVHMSFNASPGGSLASVRC